MPGMVARSTYRAGNAWFICDRCSQRWRRSRMQTEWDNLKVCPKCLDPRPPQMSPPEVYPEGVAFVDSRAPADLPDRLQDGTYLQSAMGGMVATTGSDAAYPSGQTSLGAKSPANVLTNPLPEPSSQVVEDDVTIRTGRVWPRG